MKNVQLQEMIQAYLDKLYSPYKEAIQQSKLPKGNQIYGELYYYSFVQLLKHISLSEADHFLDIGSGLGKIVFQVYLTTPVTTITGIEINHARHTIAKQIKKKIEHQLPGLSQARHPSKARTLSLIEGDFLEYDFDPVTLIYLCSSAFSFELLDAMGKKINQMETVHTVISFRKIPTLDNFKISKKIFLPATWDNVACYIYTRKLRKPKGN